MLLLWQSPSSVRPDSPSLSHATLLHFALLIEMTRRSDHRAEIVLEIMVPYFVKEGRAELPDGTSDLRERKSPWSTTTHSSLVSLPYALIVTGADSVQVEGYGGARDI